MNGDGASDRGGRRHRIAVADRGRPTRTRPSRTSTRPSRTSTRSRRTETRPPPQVTRLPPTWTRLERMKGALASAARRWTRSWPHGPAVQPARPVVAPPAGHGAKRPGHASRYRPFATVPPHSATRWLVTATNAPSLSTWSSIARTIRWRPSSGMCVPWRPTTEPRPPLIATAPRATGRAPHASERASRPRSMTPTSMTERARTGEAWADSRSTSRSPTPGEGTAGS